MKAMVRTVNDHGVRYLALMFVCPGCAEERTLENGVIYRPTGLHVLPVNSPQTKPSWDWDRNIEKPTLSPSILTGKGTENICHSFLRKGVFQFLNDSTHSLAGQFVEMPDLPDWITNERNE